MKKKLVIPFVAVAALALLIVFSLFNAGTASAYDQSVGGQYGFYYEKFDITYDIASNRKISVREEMTVKFTGSFSTGYMRDIPVNGGEQVKNVAVYELKDGKQAEIPYDVYPYDDGRNDYITADIGDGTNKFNQTHTYVLTYDYCLTKAQEGANALNLNLLGAQDRRVESTVITVLLPDGFKSAQCFKGAVLSENDYPFTAATLGGRSAIVVRGSLAHNEGITLNMLFEDGALTTYSDFTPYYFVIGGIALLLLLFAVKFLVFNKNKIVPVINYEAPEQMTPLVMGKLIDNVVDAEDVTSMIFYWADKGYLKIDLSDENDPTLIRVMQKLPEGSAAYEKILYDGLWRGNDIVKTSSLKYKFYTSVDKAKASLGSKSKGLYGKASTAASVIFAILGGLLFGFASMITAFTQISHKYLLIMPAAVGLAFSVTVYVLFKSMLTYSLKYKLKKRPPVLMILITVIAAAFSLAFTALTPSYVIPLIPKLLISVTGLAVTLCSAFIPERSPEYVKKLNGIMGFADFIQKAEKDRLEMLINENPQFYYHVLPYAQVLGVSDVWENKFADIVIPPPQWSVGRSYLEFYMINRVIRNSSYAMRSNLGSRPSSSGGGSGRGGFGGHVGGGHGGGGSRGR